MNIITFNSGRQYSDEGQRIGFVVLPDRRAYFVDVDRRIDGTIDAPHFDDQHVTSQHVMQEYDAGRYYWDAEAAKLRDSVQAAARAI